MSRSEEDWAKGRELALKARWSLYEALELIEDWPVNLDEGQELAYEIGSDLERVIMKVNSVIGICTRYWPEEQ
jgi:hypothetical protein